MRTNWRLFRDEFMIGISDWRTWAAAALILSGIMWLGGCRSAKAHSDGAMQYDIECCHSMDCAPAEKVESSAHATAYGLVPMGMTVTTKRGTVEVPPDFPRRESKDGRLHACIRAGKLLCVYVPPGQ